MSQPTSSSTPFIIYYPLSQEEPSQHNELIIPPEEVTEANEDDVVIYVDLIGNNADNPDNEITQTLRPNLLVYTIQ